MNSTFDVDLQPYLTLSIIVPDLANLLFLTSALFGMYNGIEISHPVYAVLFSNLSLATLSAVINISSINWVDISVFLIIANASNTWYMIFHCVTWSVTSILRYFYILHGQWIDKTFPDQKTLTTVSILAVFAIFSLLLTPLISIITHLGKHFKINYGSLN